MFGRSGQMFPRRTFHDAIYEEEYGSDNEDECCRCRGLSAILCWFLSVIILVGLAATVVLTVFFILRSRTLMVKPDLDVDVELYGKDSNLYDGKGGGSKELLGSHEVTTPNSSAKRKKSKGSGRGPPDATKNDVDADVNEEQNAINDSSSNDSSSEPDHDHDAAEDASINHARSQHPRHQQHPTHNRNRLQPYSPVKTTTTSSTSTTTSTTEAPSEEEHAHESSSEEETDAEQGNEEGSSLFNLFSGPRNPSYSTPSQNEEEEEEEEDEEGDEDHVEVSPAASGEYGKKNTRFQDGEPVQQVLFTESPKVTVTTSSPFGNRRNLQTTRISTGRTSFTSTSTTPAPASEESEEEESKAVNKEESEQENDAEDAEKSSEEEVVDKQKVVPVIRGRDSATSAYDLEKGHGSKESGESKVKTMLRDSIPPHGDSKDEEENEEAGGKDQETEEETAADDEEMGGMSSSSEFNLSQKIRSTSTEPSSSTTTAKPVKTTSKPSKHRGTGDTLSRLISRNFTRKTQSTTTETSAGSSEEMETQTERPDTSSTTLGPAGHKYDFTMTPTHRTKFKPKSAESSSEQETLTTLPSSTVKPTPKYTLKQRFRSTTIKPSVVTPEAPSTAAPGRTRGTTPQAASAEYSGFKLGSGGSKRGSIESPIDIVPSPDLSPKGQLKQQIQRLKEQQQRKHKEQQAQANSLEGADLNSASTEDQASKTSSEQQFLDVLVGADDKNSLVTKKTEGGIVTSAILPPWYDSHGANSSISDVLATNGTTLSNAVAKVPTTEEEGLLLSAETSFGERTSLIRKKSSEEKVGSTSSSKETAVEGPSEFERLVNMFSAQEHSTEELPSPPPTTRFGMKKQQQKPIALKKQSGSMNSRYIPQIPGRAGLFPSSSEGKSGEGQPTASPQEEVTSTNLERPPGDVGRTGVLPTAADIESEVSNSGSGYYPENGGNTNNNNMLEHQVLESERLSSDEIEESAEEDQGNPPSHVIDVNIKEPLDASTEIVIEQDSSAPAEGDDVDVDIPDQEDYDSSYVENPAPLAMSGSTPSQNVVPPPADYILRGSGVRRPMSSEETGDMEPSASAPVETNETSPATEVTATEAPKVQPPSASVAAIRRPAYTREEILKASVKPSPESVLDNDLNVDHQDEGATHSLRPGSLEEEFEEEYEDDENYDGGGSVEMQNGGASLQQWSSETTGGQRWSTPDKMMNTISRVEEPEVVAVSPSQGPRPTLSISEELADPDDMNESAESILPQHSLAEEQGPVETEPADNSTTTAGGFKPPALVSFHDNKLSFSAPTPLEGEYHSKDGWRPVINSNNGGGSGSQETLMTGSAELDDQQEEPEQVQHAFQNSETTVNQQQLPVPTLPVHVQQQLLQQQLQPQPIMQEQHQQWAQEQPPQQQKMNMMHVPPPRPGMMQLQHNSVIPPPVPATVKFPDSEEDHEDRRHHGRHRLRHGQQGQFDRAKYMSRPVPPPIVMRRRPPPNGPPYPPPGGPGRQGLPPPPPPNQRMPTPPQLMQAAASQQNPKYAEAPPPPPPPKGRPPHHPPINRNFHIRHNNPMRRFNFGGGGGGPPLAQPRSGGNIKWPTEETSIDGDNDNSQQQHVEQVQSVSSLHGNRRKRRRAPAT